MQRHFHAFIQQCRLLQALQGSLSLAFTVKERLLTFVAGGAHGLFGLSCSSLQTKQVR